jgi:hypothetical protein
MWGRGGAFMVPAFVMEALPFVFALEIGPINKFGEIPCH